MARGTTLVKLLDDLRAEARLSLNPAHNANDRLPQIKRLQRLQNWLWEDFTWPHLRVERQIPVQTGQRYYDTPEEIAIENIEKIEVFDGGVWCPVCPGIDAEQYTAWNSDLNERAWPVRRWKIHDGDDIEIWPIADQNADPATRDGFLKFTGIRNLRPLVEDGDKADLDDQLIVLYAAAEILAATGAKDAKLKQDRADARYAKLRGRLTPRKSFQMFGIGEQRHPRKLFVTSYRPPVQT